MARIQLTREQIGICQVGELRLPIFGLNAEHLEEEGFASLTKKQKVVTTHSFLLFLFKDGYLHESHSTIYPISGYLTK